MRKFLTLLTLVAATAAFAGDVNVGTLTSTDGGTSGSVTLTPHLDYSIQCSVPSCYKTASSAVAVVCTSAYQLPAVVIGVGTQTLAGTGTFLTTDAGGGGSGSGTTSQAGTLTDNSTVVYARDFNAGSSTKVYAAATGGAGHDGTCQVFQRTK